MIRTIQHVKAFGVFADFRWPSGLPEFKQFNLIYGWNYSGKTTLSRVFRCFERQQLHADFPAAEGRLKIADASYYDLSNPHEALLIRVFNTDFVRDNLRFESGSAVPILVLGAEEIAKQEALKETKAQREVLLSNRALTERERESKRTTIERALSNCARDMIKTPLAVPGYDKTRFEPRVKEVMNAPDSFRLEEDSLRLVLSLYQSTDKKPFLSPKKDTLSSLEHVRQNVATLLRRVVTANVPLRRLKDNPKLESWVKDGRPLHEGGDCCQFCGQRLPADLMTSLAGHFSADYEDLTTELAAIGETVRVARTQTIILDNKAEFYAELSERFTAEKTLLDDLLEARMTALDSLARAITAKQTKAFTILECPPMNDPSTKITAAIQAINELISEHNTRTAEFETKRKEALAKLERHYAAALVLELDYSAVLQQITRLEALITNLTEQLLELNSKVCELEKDVSEASIGADQINELLAAYFGRNDLRIVVSPEDQFQIVREGLPATNLSEGERTAIAFAYFITRLRDGRHLLADTRVVIDDPISSLDSNHIFNTYALIKTQLAGCKQLFIATHSFEFYNLIRDWASEDEKGWKTQPQSNWKRWGVYLVKRTASGAAALEEIPKELLRFKSEYHYLFSTLFHFDKAGSDDFDRLLSLPNVVRRFMEAFAGVMIPVSAGLHVKMPRLFPEEIERERVWKFVNDYSHNTSMTRSLTIPDTSECRAVVQSCLKAVREWDADYFRELVEEVQ
ncbi:MAG: AAA family ATPase [Thermoanaerobaculia bacterium]|jgi:wobble nucleotide-excising tRNase